MMTLTRSLWRTWHQGRRLNGAYRARYLGICAVLLLPLTTPVALATEAQYPVDPTSQLIMAPGWELVRGQCNACHTSAIIAQNPGNRKVWRETLQWMIDTQGLWQLSDTWEPVLDYLVANYGEKQVDMSRFRRMPLRPELQPPMPQAKE